MDEAPDPPFLPDFWQSVRFLLLGFVAFAIIGGGILLLGLPVRNRRGGRRPIRLAWLPGFGLALIGLVLTIHFPAVALAEFLPAFPAWAKRVFIGAGFLALVILVPDVEEAVFRGLILGGHVRKYRPVEAILLCGLIFAISHRLPWQFPVAFVCGALFSCLWSRPEASSSPGSATPS